MVDQTAPPATEKQQQNGNPITGDAGAAAAAASSLPAADSIEGAPTPPSSGTSDWYAREMGETSGGSSRMKWLGAAGGALLLVAGIGGFMFMRRRHRASRRDQALQAARESAMMAAESIASVTDAGKRLAAAMPGRSDVESAIGHNARRASKMARHARKKMPV